MNVPSSAGGFGTEHDTAWYLPADLLERAAERALPAEVILVLLAYFKLLGRPEDGNQAVRKEALAEALGGSVFGPDKDRADGALEQTLKAGFLLSFENVLLANTPNGRDLLLKLQNGEVTSAQLKVVSQLPAPERPNIFRLYEANIGPLTPMMAEMLKEDAREYPPQWIEDAVGEAVERNIRNWRYVRAILKTWKEKGREDRSKPTEGYLEKYRKLYEEQKRRRRRE